MNARGATRSSQLAGDAAACRALADRHQRTRRPERAGAGRPATAGDRLSRSQKGASPRRCDRLRPSFPNDSHRTIKRNRRSPLCPPYCSCLGVGRAGHYCRRPGRPDRRHSLVVSCPKPLPTYAPAPECCCSPARAGSRCLAECLQCPCGRAMPCRSGRSGCPWLAG